VAPYVGKAAGAVLKQAEKIPGVQMVEKKAVQAVGNVVQAVKDRYVVTEADALVATVDEAAGSLFARSAGPSPVAPAAGSADAAAVAGANGGLALEQARVGAAGGSERQLIDTSQVRFSQDSISANFKKGGGSVNDLAAALRGAEGEQVASKVPPIRLVEHEGQLFTLDNRRLAAFAAANRQVPYRMASAEEIAAEWLKKFTTGPEQQWGRYITVRPGR
jgi:hypothetical protein